MAKLDDFEHSSVYCPTVGLVYFLSFLCPIGFSGFAHNGQTDTPEIKSEKKIDAFSPSFDEIF